MRGTALALGYYNAPEQTAGSFVQNPGNSHFPELIYRTGDLGILDEAGELYFSGRRISRSNIWDTGSSWRKSNVRSIR